MNQKIQKPPVYYYDLFFPVSQRVKMLLFRIERCWRAKRSADGKWFFFLLKNKRTRRDDQKMLLIGISEPGRVMRVCVFGEHCLLFKQTVLGFYQATRLRMRTTSIALQALASKSLSPLNNPKFGYPVWQPHWARWLFVDARCALSIAHIRIQTFSQIRETPNFASFFWLFFILCFCI